jgi:xanthine dehydrogenase accessory factor
MMEFWQILQEELVSAGKLMLMYVIQSEGSSPGRQGFKMLVSASGRLYGTIGGGIMEHKLVELSRQKLQEPNCQPFLKRQIHRDNTGADQSGLICSGEQSVGFYRLTRTDRELVEKILNAMADGRNGVLSLSEKGMDFEAGTSLSQCFATQVSSPEQWIFREDLGFQPVLNIIGGGHVGLALSRFADQLGFRVRVFDNRPGLNTLGQNSSAQWVPVLDYQEIGDYVGRGENQYLTLMSFGYETDKMLLRQLVGKQWAYLGLMGSKAKVARLFAELKREGLTPDQLAKVHAPIGLAISSQTPEEIAISILAEIIAVKNGRERQ